MKYNKNLLQLDLSHTGLQENLLRELVTCLRRSKSLLTLDVSGNLTNLRRPEKTLNYTVRGVRMNAYTGECSEGYAYDTKRDVCKDDADKEYFQQHDALRGYLSNRIRCKPDPLDIRRLSYICDYIADLNKTYQ